MRSSYMPLLKALLLLMLTFIIIAFTLFSLYSLFPAPYRETIEKYCKKYDVDPHLVLSLIKAESNFSPSAASSAGAGGLMQITEDTFSYCISSMGISPDEASILDPDDNINVGIWYLSTLLKKYSGNTVFAVAAYNAGPSNVDKWLSQGIISHSEKDDGNIPFEETSRHVTKVDMYRKIYKFLYPGR